MQIIILLASLKRQNRFAGFTHLFAMLRIDPQVSQILGKHCSTELLLQVLILILSSFTVTNLHNGINA